MRIKNIKVSGFKSFCHPINLKIKQNGITIVVGPNGCGKSNVVDAVRWVLGEQRAKHLRGGTMEDVIFSGTSLHKPSGLAEVILTFSNPEGDLLRQYSDYTEIAVSRKLYRSGESVYMINKTPVRLKDIRELFMDTGIGGTGYSIIEQGRVGEIVGSKPNERRTLIDDAAGIVKFRFKRETAEKRLDETTQNLFRVNDVLETISEQEIGLREHVEKAEKFLELREQCELLERQHLCMSLLETTQKQENVQEIFQGHQQKQEDLQNEKSIVETEMERLKLEQTQRSVQLGEQRERLFKEEQKIQDAENQRKLERQNLQNVNDNQKSQEFEIQKLRQRLNEVNNERLEMDSRLKSFKNILSEKRIDLEKVEDERSKENEELQKTNDELSEVQKNLLSVHTELTNQNNQKNFINERLENLSERQQRLQAQEKSHISLLHETSEKVSDIEKRLEKIIIRKKELSGMLSTSENKLSKQQLQLDETEKQLEDVLYQKNTAKSRVESLQQIQKHYEGFSDSVKILMQLMEENPETKTKFGILGLLADFITVSSEILDDVSPVLAEVLDWVVIESADTLQQLEVFCSEHELGQIHFVALDRYKFFSENSENMGIPLKNILNINDHVRGWCERFFTRFSLLEDEKNFWDEANKNWPENPLERLSSSGVRISNTKVSIGKPQSSSLGFLQRQQEISDVEEYSINLQNKIDKLESEIDISSELCESLKKEHHLSEEELRKLELESLSCNKELEHHQLEERRNRQTVKQISQDSENIDKEINTSEQKVNSATIAISNLEKDRDQLEEKTQENQDLIQIQQGRADSIAEKLLGLRISLTEISEQEKNTEELEKRLQQEFTDITNRIEQLESNHLEGRNKIKNSQKRINEIDTSFDGMLEKRSAMKVELEEEIKLHEQKNEEQTLLTQKLHERQGLLEKAVDVAHQESLKMTELRIHREQLENQLREITTQSQEEILAELDIEKTDIHKLGQEFRTLKIRLNSMGSVNLSAPEEYATLTERINFLKSQSDDLQKAIDDLKETIKDINIESRRRFKEMFEIINDNFKNVFSKLFEGGEAKLLLTESEDLLNAGVDIMAQPPGKKLQNINLLSGGEKALTAISLIFAIFLVKPSPFCFLDEVDAPLDDVNIVRFNKLITSLSYDSQFILITHNKKTMEIGELMYGVTMEDPGISKTVSVEFQEAQRLIA